MTPDELPVWPWSTCLYDPCLPVCMTPVYLSVWPLSTCLMTPVYLSVWPIQYLVGLSIVSVVNSTCRSGVCLDDQSVFLDVSLLPPCKPLPACLSVGCVFYSCSNHGGSWGLAWTWMIIVQVCLLWVCACRWHWGCVQQVSLSMPGIAVPVPITMINNSSSILQNQAGILVSAWSTRSATV